MELTQEILKQKLIYRRGNLYWKVTIGNKKKGQLAGWVCTYGNDKRRRIQILKNKFMQSQLVFLYHKGYIPEVVDHINGNALDDKIGNLRAATTIQNSRNRKSNKNSSSKYKGVCFEPKSKKWRAYIFLCKKQKHLGLFDTEDEAALCHNKQAIIHHGEFANLNIVI